MDSCRKICLIWELPQVILGSALYLFFFKKIKKKKKHNNLNIYFVEDFPGGISLAFMVYIDAKSINDIKTLNHEYGHSIQSIMLGWLYIPVIGIPSIIRSYIWKKLKLKSEDYYERFPENWADKLGEVKR